MQAGSRLEAYLCRPPLTPQRLALLCAERARAARVGGDRENAEFFEALLELLADRDGLLGQLARQSERITDLTAEQDRTERQGIADGAP